MNAFKSHESSLIIMHQNILNAIHASNASSNSFYVCLTDSSIAMDEKTQSTNPENTDTIIVPLPIDNEETEDEETSPKQPPLPMDDHVEPEPYMSPPPLPIKDDDPLLTPTPIVEEDKKPLSPYHPPPPPPVRSPPKFAASHVRMPPPLTPMSAIDAHGGVIYSNSHGLPPSVHNGHDYLPPPPPPRGYNDYHPYPNASQSPSFAIEYNCKPCGLVFNTKHELLGHKRDAHGSGGDDMNSPMRRQHMMGRRARFHCNICNRDFSAKQHFEYHMRTHSGEKPFKCPTCGKAFRAKHSLKNHLRIHTGERPYQCKVCGKWFRQLGVMKNHIKNMHNR
eukprot:715708_1